jgi:hypothetical protein
MDYDVGPARGLDLRVSAATLSRILFHHPDDNTPMLALEHKATLNSGENKARVTVRAQPFGGAVRILKPERLRKSLGNFNYDSERSRAEGDFRIFIEASKWAALLDFCKRASLSGEDAAIDHDPTRELVEEFNDTLGIQLMPSDYTIERVAFVVEKDPRPTDNVRAPGHPTARVYWIDDVEIKNPDLSRLMLRRGPSSHDLSEKAMNDLNKGGRGRANALYSAPLEKIRAAYLKLTPEERNEPLEFEGVTLSSNVPAILESVETPKFEWRG